MNQWQSATLRPVYAPAGVHNGGRVERISRLPFDVMQWQEPGASVAQQWVVSPTADSGQHYVDVTAGDRLDDAGLTAFGFYDHDRLLLDPGRTLGEDDAVEDIHFFGPI